MLLLATEFAESSDTARRKVVGSREGWEAVGVSTCRTSQPALILLNSAPKSLVFTCVSLCHLFLGCTVGIFFPEMVNFFPLPSLTTHTMTEGKVNKVKVKCQMKKLRGFKNCLFYVSTCWKLAQTSHYLSARRYQSRCDRVEKPLPCQSICWRFDNKVPLYNSG